MAAVMTAKWLSDFFCKSIYDEQIEMKSITMLEPHPPHTAKLFNIPAVMHKNVRCIRFIDSVENIMDLLKNTTHNGFPVVRDYPGRNNVYVGFILRKQLLILLFCKLYQGVHMSTPGMLEYEVYIDLMTQRTLKLEALDIPPENLWSELFLDVRPCTKLFDSIFVVPKVSPN